MTTVVDSARLADPGLEALVTLLHFQGVAADAGQIRHRLGTDKIGAPEMLRCVRSKHTRQWPGCGNSIPRCVFPLSKTCWALTGVPKTSRDTKKDCVEPGCPNDHRSQMLARGDEDRMSATSVVGTKRT